MGARIVINTFICITQIGFCCVFLVFVGDNLQQVVRDFTDVSWDSRVFMAIASVPLIFLNWIRNLKLLTPVSVISNLLQIFSIVVVFYYVLQDLPAISTRPAFQSWGGLPLFFGTAIYTFEGIALVLPLQKDMRKPQYFKGWTGVLNIGMFIVTCLYFNVGLFGYWKYGDAIESSITLNLPKEHILAQTVKIFMVLAICGSYAMQLYVPIPIMWPSVSKYFYWQRQHWRIHFPDTDGYDDLWICCCYTAIGSVHFAGRCVRKFVFELDFPTTCEPDHVLAQCKQNDAG